MNKPKVSIIFPVYGVADVVETSLRSVLAQTYRPLQLVVVNDCTPDNSMEVIGRVIARGDNSVSVSTVTHEHNGGLSKARNTGIEHSDGEYVFFLDSDDTLSPDAIEKLMDAILRNGSEIAEGNFDIPGHKSLFYNHQNNQTYSGDAILKALYGGKIHGSACNKLIHRPLLDNITFEEGVLYEDVEWVLRLCGKAKKCTVIPDFTYNYIIRNGSITRSIDREKSLKRLSSYRNMLTRSADVIKGYADTDVYPAARRWLASKTVRVKFNLHHLDLTRDEIGEFFSWAKTQPSTRSGLFGLLNRLSPAMFNLMVILPLKHISK